MLEPYHSWIFFFVIILILLGIDLSVHRFQKHKKETVTSALIWSGIWISLALVFNIWVYFSMGKEAALNFLAGYIVEKSLSVDNLFIFLVIFKTFSIPAQFRHKILFWGVIGAIIMRGIFISGGIALLNYFDWLFYIFGAFLIITAIKLAREHLNEIHPENNKVVKWFSSYFPVISSCESGKFFTVIKNKTYATPLFLALITVETTDLIFAVDSIPAIFGITLDPFIVFTSNIFAILGLRSLYFALEGVMALFTYLNYGLAAILFFIGLKMLVSNYIHIPTEVSLITIASVLTLSIGLSLYMKKNE